MKFKFLAVALLLLASPFASAACGNNPKPPKLLDESQLDQQQVSTLDTQMESYFDQVKSFRSCIDTEVGELVTEGTPDSYYDSPEYQARFNQLTKKGAAAEQRMQDAIERYNYLLEILAD